jgi:hypothetical protein
MFGGRSNTLNCRKQAFDCDLFAGGAVIVIPLQLFVNKVAVPKPVKLLPLPAYPARRTHKTSDRDFGHSQLSLLRIPLA